MQAGDDRAVYAPADAANRPTWSKPETVAQLSAEGWADEGERVALLEVADELRGGRVLDIGVGTGRTTSLLRLLTSDYVGIDYTEAMLTVARSRHPNVDLRLADARDLETFGTQTFDAVVFSFNGIDALDHSDRQQVLREARRVLRPGGRLLLSTLNKSGPSWNERPWHQPPLPWVIGSLVAYRPGRAVRLLRTAYHSIGGAPSAVRATRSWAALQAQRVDEGSWGMAPIAAHGFGLLVHLSTLPAAVAELQAIGFSVDRIYAAGDARLLRPDEDPTDVHWFQFVAVAEHDLKQRIPAPSPPPR